MKRQARAFKIDYSHRFVDGRRVPRSDYYETDNPVLIEHLIRSQGAQEVPLRSEPVAPPKPLAEQPTMPREAEIDPDVVSEKQPNWDFRTISDMRAYLDACGVELPSSNARKAIHVQTCRAAWEEGRRPHPLYGFPGGPKPSAGMSGPNYLDPEVCEDAIATAEAAGYAIPQELRDHLDKLTAPPVEDEVEEPELDAEAEEAAEPVAEAAE